MKTLHAPDVVGDLLLRLQSLQPETPAVWGKMSAHQMVCHLRDSFEFAMGLKPASEKITFAGRTVARWIALHTAVRWPQGVATRPELDQLIGGTRPLEFARDTRSLADVIERFAAQPRSYSFARHPFFGELTAWEWMRWGFRHADHHLRQFGR